MEDTWINFGKESKKFTIELDFKLMVLFSLNFDVDIDGNITNVHIPTNIPLNLSDRLKSYFENIKGWTPAIRYEQKNTL